MASWFRYLEAQQRLRKNCVNGKHVIGGGLANDSPQCYPSVPICDVGQRNMRCDPTGFPHVVSRGHLFVANRRMCCDGDRHVPMADVPAMVG